MIWHQIRRLHHTEIMPLQITEKKTPLGYNNKVFNSPRQGDAYMSQWICHHWLIGRPVTCSAPSHYLNHPGIIVNWMDHIILVCLFVSLPSHFWLILFFQPTPALSTISGPLSSSMCSITPETANVGSSYNRMRGPGIGCWFSDRSNCSSRSINLTFTLTSENLSLYTTLLLLLVFIQLSWLQLLSYTV